MRWLYLGTMSWLLGIFKNIRSELFWKERIITIFIVLTYILGNGIEYYNGKLTNDSPLVWMLGVVLGSAVVIVSLSRWNSYTSILFKVFLLHVNFNIIYAYGQSTQGPTDTESFYVLMCYILFVVSSQALDSRRELTLFTIAEILFFIIIVYINLENSPILMQPMHQFILLFVLIGNIIVNHQRFKLTQAGVNSNVQFKTLSENGRDAQLILNNKFQFVYLNPAAELLTGHKIQQIMKMQFYDLIVAEDVEKVRNILSKATIEDEVRLNTEFRLVSSSGKHIWVESIFSSFRSGPGLNEKLIFAETRNIEKRKELEQEIQQKLKVEEMLIKHSNEFINVDRKEILHGVDVALSDFGKMLGADGALVYRMHGKLHDEFRSTNQWFDNPLLNLNHYFNLVVKINQQLILFLRSIKGDKATHGNFVLHGQLHEIQVTTTDDIPGKFFYLVPLQSGNIVNGFVIFVFDDKVKNVSSSFFGLIGNMIASAFTRLRTEMRLHEAQLTNEFILRALPDWLYMLNNKGEFTGSNNYSTLTPYLHDYDLIGRSFKDVLPKETVPLFEKALTEVIETDLTASFEFEDSNTHKGRFFKALLAPFKANEYLLIIRDITDLKLAQSELENKATKLELSNKELEEFAYIVSHDMKQPIRTIISYLSLLKRKHGAVLNDEALEFLNYSIEGANKMSGLIRDILQYSRLEQQISFVSDVPLNNVVGKVISGLNEIITTNHAKVTVTDMPTVKGNDTMLSELFQNLIENGIKYNTKAEKTVHITVTDEDPFWLFKVSDNGIGFDQEYSEQIFKIFKRLHNDHEFQGTGIGLSVCQKVVTKHGGKIWAESKEGKGSSFYFTLPKIQNN